MYTKLNRLTSVSIANTFTSVLPQDALNESHEMLKFLASQFGEKHY